MLFEITGEINRCLRIAVGLARMLLKWPFLDTFQRRIKASQYVIIASITINWYKYSSYQTHKMNAIISMSEFYVIEGDTNVSIHFWKISEISSVLICIVLIFEWHLKENVFVVREHFWKNNFIVHFNRFQKLFSFRYVFEFSKIKCWFQNFIINNNTS